MQDLIFAFLSNTSLLKYEFSIYTPSGTYYTFMNPSIYDEDIEPFVEFVFNPSAHILLMKTHTYSAANDIYFFSYFSRDILVKAFSAVISNFIFTMHFVFYFVFIFSLFLVLKINFIFF